MNTPQVHTRPGCEDLWNTHKPTKWTIDDWWARDPSLVPFTFIVVIYHLQLVLKWHKPYITQVWEDMCVNVYIKPL